jgi:hypothetical protein
MPMLMLDRRSIGLPSKMECRWTDKARSLCRRRPAGALILGGPQRHSLLDKKIGMINPRDRGDRSRGTHSENLWKLGEDFV